VAGVVGLNRGSATGARQPGENVQHGQSFILKGICPKLLQNKLQLT